MKKISIILLAFVTFNALKAQKNSNQNERADELQFNSITTAVPFLNITPDSRSGALGDAGVALSPSVNSIHWNPAQLAFVENDVEFGFSYSPWLRALVNDMNIGYLSGYKKLNKISTVAASLRYFSLGTISFTNEQGDAIRDFTPIEWAIDGAYSLKMSDNLSAGVALRYIRSNLTGGNIIPGADTKPGQSVAFDVSTYYVTDKFDLADKRSRLRAGLNISNVGNKMAYTNNNEEDFIPANLRLGTALEMDLDDYNAITVTFDLNKLLVPTPNGALDTSDQKVTPIEAIFGSFNDAPAGGKEELREINIGGGVEYRYTDILAFRLGYFNEHVTKGDRKYATMGAGLKYSAIKFDLSYILSLTRNNPLANTLRFSMTYTFNKESDSSDENLID